MKIFIDEIVIVNLLLLFVLALLFLHQLYYIRWYKYSHFISFQIIRKNSV